MAQSLPVFIKLFVKMAKLALAGKRKEHMRKIIGIDQGTTYSAVAAMEGNNPQIIVNAEGVAPPL